MKEVTNQPDIDKLKVSLEATNKGLIAHIDDDGTIKQSLGDSKLNSISKTLTDIIEFYQQEKTDLSQLDINVNSALDLICNLKPNDLLEQQLIIQMINTHHLFQKCSSRANIKEQSGERIDQYIKSLNKLSQLYINQLKALTRYRNKGQQKVKVEHIHISEGGKAIIGDIHTGRGG